MYKRITSLILVFVLAMSLAVPAYAADDKLDKGPEHEDHQIYGNDTEIGSGQTDISLEITNRPDPCEHEFAYTDNGDGTHSGTCTKCQAELIKNEKHTDLDDNLLCDKDGCNAAVNCAGNYYRYEENEGGATHKKVCTSSNHAEHVLVTEEAHELVEGTCVKCGYTTECQHETFEIESDGTGKHSYKCTVDGGCGSVYKTENCSDMDDDLYCDVEGCGYKFPCRHEDANWLAENITSWTSNGAGQHSVTCPHENCGETITQDCKSADSDCTCDAPGCGYAGCHSFKWVDDKNDKTHTWQCGKCQTSGTPPVGHDATEPHKDEDNDNYCDDCLCTMDNVGVPVLVATIPAEIPISATVDGVVTVPTDASIVNNSSRSMYVSNVDITLSSTWKPVSIKEDFSSKPKGTKEIGLSMRGDDFTGTEGSFEGSNWVISGGEKLNLNVACRIPAQSESIAASSLGNIRFKLAWCPDTDAATSDKTAGATDQSQYNQGLGDKSITLTVTKCEHGTIDVNSVVTDKDGYVVQLPVVTAEKGWKFVTWWWKHPSIPGLNMRVAVGSKMAMAGNLEAEFVAVSAGTITFDTSALQGGSVTPATIQTNENGMLTEMPVVSGLPNSIRVEGWYQEDSNVKVGVGTHLNGDVTLYPRIEYNYVDMAKVREEIGANSGELVFSSSPASDVGADVSAFGNKAYTLTKSGNVYTVSGEGVTIGNNWNSEFSGLSGLTSIDISALTDKPTSAAEAFSGCSSLTGITGLSALDMSECTSLAGMFKGCSALTINGELNNWDVSKVTTTVEMFSGCSSVTTLNLMNWKTTSLKNMSGMFDRCTSLATAWTNNFDTSKVTQVVNMFNNCSSMTSFKGNNWDLSNCTHLNQMFGGCMSLKSITLPNINVDEPPEVTMMFAGMTNTTVTVKSDAISTYLSGNAGADSTVTFTVG